MLWLIRIVGGLLIMMGQPDRSEACSTTSARKIRLLRPLLRFIEKHMSFAFVREDKSELQRDGTP